MGRERIYGQAAWRLGGARRFLNERGQLEKIGFLIGVIIVGIVISMFLELGDPYNLAPLIGAVIVVLLIYIGIKG